MTMDYAKEVLDGSPRAVARLISWLEDEDERAYQCMEELYPQTGRAYIIGITGSPGAGKSTLTDKLTYGLRQKGLTVGIVAVDPSSPFTGGAVLGDRVRMSRLSTDPGVFIRSMATRGFLGGLAKATADVVRVLDASGKDIVIIETVGVGQSETAVHSMVDFFLLLMLAGAGDELQGIKRGIMEMADAIAITKADGENIAKTERAKGEYSNAIHLFPPSDTGWTPRVMTCSARTSMGIEEIWNTIMEYKTMMQQKGYFERKRLDQSLYWMYETINQNLKDSFYHDRRIQKMLKIQEARVLMGELTPFTPARALMEKYFKRHWIRFNYRR